ncbi:MAG: hypothetical protein ACN4GG_02345 [Akkermansiaceae bacterium]
MSDLWFSPYQLQSAVALNALSKNRVFHGALIRQGSGFGCIHPWPELGDPSLSECLANPESHLMQRTLACAQADGEAREKNISLFQHLAVPKSHATLPRPSHDLVEKALLAGFTVIKIKANQTLGSLKALFHDFPEVRWRIDFNGSADEAQLRADLVEITSKIDFLEDPFPFSQDQWAVFEKTTKTPLANDWAVEGNSSCGIHVIKPAVNDPAPILERPGRKIFTSYMDHPLGQAFAAWQTALAPQSLKEVHGLQTHQLFKMNPFIEALGPAKPEFQIPTGPGLGFGDLLESLDWQKL